MPRSFAARVIATAKGLGLATTFVALGGLYSLSNAVVPSILATLNSGDGTTSARNASKSFAVALRASKQNIPPAELLSICCFSFLSVNAYRLIGYPSHRGPLYAGAAAAMFAVIPLTMATMTPIETRLLQLADTGVDTASKSDESSPQEVEAMMLLWSSRNMWRRVFVSISGVLGLLAVLK